MYITYLKSKIAHGRVTQAELYYEGSITIDEVLLKEVGIVPGEKVEVLNMNNGSRIETYAIAGKANSGVLCLNGAAARSGVVGDQIIILSYAMMTPEEARAAAVKIVHLGEHNRIKSRTNLLNE